MAARFRLQMKGHSGIAFKLWRLRASSCRYFTELVKNTGTKRVLVDAVSPRRARSPSTSEIVYLQVILLAITLIYQRFGNCPKVSPGNPGLSTVCGDVHPNA